MLRLKALAGAALLMCLSMAPAPAETAAEFPSRPIKLIVGFPPGGGPDPLARIIAAGLERRLGKPVVVENVVGGSGLLAARTTARAAPDGYTLQFVEMSFAVAPHTSASYNVSPQKDFTPVGFAVSAPFSLIISRELPTANLAEFVKYAKAQPDKILMGHSGVGSTPYLGVVSFSRAVDIKPQLVAYRGVNDASSNTMSGIITGYFSSGAQTIGAVNNDKLRVLAVTGDKRMAKLPDIPTFSEHNITLRGFEIGAWFGLVAPAGTPADIVQKINTALNDIKSDTDAQTRFAAIGATFRPGSPSEFRDFLAAQDELWRKTLGELGVKPE